MRSKWVLAVVVMAGLLTACGGPVPGKTGAAGSGRTKSAMSWQTEDVIARTQATLRINPANWQAVDTLAGAYLQRVREVGDPSYYPKAEALLSRALSHDVSDAEATTLMGVLSLARHQFAAALEWGQKAQVLDPAGSRPFGVMGDAQVELGRYPEALRSFQRMIDLRPDLSSYARVSYARELYGDVPGAIEAMQKAVEAGGPVAENSAYTRVLLGNLFFNSGRLGDAESQYRRALFDDPGYPAALVGIARLESAKGRFEAAIAHYRQAVDVYPLPDFVIGMGDAYAAAGDRQQATESYDLAAAEQQLFRANGVDLDAELALFDADHQRDLSVGLAAARAAIVDRPSVRTADILAWTLYQVGDYPNALAATRHSHRLGTQDALFFFHTGMIEAKLGMNEAAISDLQKALQINPYFSVLWVPLAHKTLASLGSAA